MLRIEDSDTERNTKESLNSLLSNLRWLGLNWDEGPEVGGSYGPYFQSERGDVYQKHLKRLRDEGKVYEKDGALWLKVSGETQTIDDIIHGPVQRLEEKDFVIYRSNGTPVFHFVNVVDDMEMKITHVIRGCDHIDNTQALLIVGKAARVNLVKESLAAVAERRVPQIVAHCNGFGKVLVKIQCPCDSPGNLRDFKSMSKTSSVVVSFRRKEDLSLVHQPS